MHMQSPHTHTHTRWHLISLQNAANSVFIPLALAVCVCGRGDGGETGRLASCTCIDCSCNRLPHPSLRPLHLYYTFAAFRWQLLSPPWPGRSGSSPRRSCPMSTTMGRQTSMPWTTEPMWPNIPNPASGYCAPRGQVSEMKPWKMKTNAHRAHSMTLRIRRVGRACTVLLMRRTYTHTHTHTRSIMPRDSQSFHQSLRQSVRQSVESVCQSGKQINWRRSRQLERGALIYLHCCTDRVAEKIQKYVNIHLIPCTQDKRGLCLAWASWQALKSVCEWGCSKIIINNNF